MLGDAGIFWRILCGGRRRMPLGFTRLGLWVRGVVQTVGETGTVIESRNGGGTGLQRRIRSNRSPSLTTDHVKTES